MDEFDYVAWQKANQDVGSLRGITFDLNGVMRGKRLPVSQLKKITSGQMRMPLSTANVDIWGRDIENSKWVFATGDADGAGRGDTGAAACHKTVQGGNGWHCALLDLLHHHLDLFLIVDGMPLVGEVAKL